MIRFQALWKTKSFVKVCLKFKLPLWTKGLLIHLSPLWQLPLWHFPRWHNFPVFVALVLKWVSFFGKIWYKNGSTFQISAVRPYPNHTWVGPPGLLTGYTRVSHIKGVLHLWALFLKTLCIFSKNKATLDKVSYGSGQKYSKELKNHSFTSVEAIVVKLQWKMCENQYFLCFEP